MSETLQGVSVIITGGTRGIGRGMADAFVADGADVVITGRDADLGEQVAAGLDQRGPGRCRFFRGDVADSGMADEMARFTLEAYGKIDVVCANAGIYEAKAIQLLTEEDLDQVFATNVKGTIFAVQACLPALEKSGRGRIILTSSITGPVTGFAGFAHYGASKAAQLGFMRTAAIELAAKGITVNAILPANILTEGLEALGEALIRESVASIPMRRLGTLADVACAALFFASERAGYITGQTLTVDGGQVLPQSPQALEFPG